MICTSIIFVIYNWIAYHVVAFHRYLIWNESLYLRLRICRWIKGLHFHFPKISSPYWTIRNLAFLDFVMWTFIWGVWFDYELCSHIAWINASKNCIHLKMILSFVMYKECKNEFCSTYFLIVLFGFIIPPRRFIDSNTCIYGIIKVIHIGKAGRHSCSEAH